MQAAPYSHPVLRTAADHILPCIHHHSSTLTANISQNISQNAASAYQSAKTQLFDQTAADISAGALSYCCGCSGFPDNLLPHADVSHARSLAEARAASQNVAQITPEPGVTTKDIWVASSGDLTTFAKMKATLRAAGSHCYVWIADDYYSDTAGGSMVTTAQAQAAAEKFDALYDVERYIFGEESDLIYYYNGTGWALEDMSILSDTGTKVNIVLYDIPANGPNSIINGYWGQFSHYPNKEHALAMGYTGSDLEYLAYSNEGKYFYIDSYAYNKNQAKTFSTLAHEFQHMIQFNIKIIQQGIDNPVWYQEMCSMLCEDMLQNYLEVTDLDSQKSRFMRFNPYYFLSGLVYDNSTDSQLLITYAGIYAFGAWLARQYDGAALVKEIVRNNSTGTASITAAVNALNSTSYTICDLRRQFAEACIFSTPSQYSLDQDAARTVAFQSGSTYYSYPMTAIQIWDSTYGWILSGTSLSTFIPFTASGTDSSGKYLGPNLCKAELYATLKAHAPAVCKLRPYGMVLFKVGTASSDTVTVNFSSGGSTDQIFTLMAQ